MNLNLGFINNFFNNLTDYFKNLSQYEMYSWMAIAVGLILIIIAIILW
jgi:heme exporter protein D